MSVRERHKFRMAFSGRIHGPPLIDQPGQFCILNERPSRRHSAAAWATIASQSTLRQGIGFVTPGHVRLSPICPWNR